MHQAPVILLAFASWLAEVPAATPPARPASGQQTTICGTTPRDDDRCPVLRGSTGADNDGCPDVWLTYEPGHDAADDDGIIAEVAAEMIRLARLSQVAIVARAGVGEPDAVLERRAGRIADELVRLGVARTRLTTRLETTPAGSRGTVRFEALACAGGEPVAPPATTRAPEPNPAPEWMVLPSLRVSIGATLALAENTQLAAAADATVGFRALAPPRALRFGLAAEAGYSYGAYGGGPRHLLALGAGPCLAWGETGVGWMPRFLLGKSAGTDAAGVRNGLMLYLFGGLVTGEAAFDYLNAGGHGVHDIRLTASLDLGLIALAFSHWDQHPPR
jgi:hypothetical protein